MLLCRCTTQKNVVFKKIHKIFDIFVITGSSMSFVTIAFKTNVLKWTNVRLSSSYVEKIGAQIPRLSE